MCPLALRYACMRIPLGAGFRRVPGTNNGLRPTESPVKIRDPGGVFPIAALRIDVGRDQFPIASGVCNLGRLQIIQNLEINSRFNSQVLGLAGLLPANNHGHVRYWGQS